MKRIIKVFSVIFIIVILTVMYFTFTGNNNKNNQEIEDTQPITAQNEKFRIGVIQFDDSDMYADACNSFVKQLSNMGLNNGENITVTMENAYGKQENCRSISQTYVENKFDLIYAIGTKSAISAYSITKDIPIVFAAVSDPESSGLVKSNEKPDTNVTGVSNYTPCFEQIDLIKEIYPNAKKVGTVYTQGDADSLLQINISKKEAEKNQLQINEYPVEEGKNVIDIFNKAISENEVIYLPTDTQIKDQIESIAKIAIEKNIPIIAGDEDMVVGGCLATYGIDYNSLGKNAAQMAVEILYSKQPPKTMTVRYVSECNLFINESVLKQLEITLPDELSKKANLI